MSFQNFGQTPSGRKFFRGEAILVEHTTHLLCGRISEISTGDGGESIVFPTVDQGVLNTMGGDVSKNVPDTAYLAQGFHHQSTTQTRVGGAKPSLFCFGDETPSFAMAGTGDAERAPVVDEVTQAAGVIRERQHRYRDCRRRATRRRNGDATTSTTRAEGKGVYEKT